MGTWEEGRSPVITVPLTEQERSNMDGAFARPVDYLLQSLLTKSVEDHHTLYQAFLCRISRFEVRCFNVNGDQKEGREGGGGQFRGWLVRKGVPPCQLQVNKLATPSPHIGP